MARRSATAATLASAALWRAVMSCRSVTGEQIENINCSCQGVSCRRGLGVGWPRAGWRATMNVVEPGSPAEGVVRRAVRLLLNPLGAWDEIAADDETIEGVYRRWVLPLAAIPAVCGAIGQLGFGGVRIFGIPFHRNVLGILADNLVGYALTLGAVYVLALVIDELAIPFGGERSRTQALKLAAYSSTAL